MYIAYVYLYTWGTWRSLASRHNSSDFRHDYFPNECIWMVPGTIDLERA